jgi:hypothetical protein
MKSKLLIFSIFGIKKIKPSPLQERLSTSCLKNIYECFGTTYLNRIFYLTAAFKYAITNPSFASFITASKTLPSDGLEFKMNSAKGSSMYF